MFPSRYVFLDRTAVFIAFGLLVTGCSPGGDGVSFVDPSRSISQSGGGGAVRQTPSNQLPQNLRPSSAPTGVYQVAAGDVIDVAIFQSPNLNRTVEVDGAGNVVLPLVGAVPVAGKTVRTAEGEIARRYGERYLQNPDVTIFLREAVGQRVTVDGAIRKTGFVIARANSSLLNIIAESGGVTETADESNVIVFRPTAEGRVAARFDVKAIRQGQAPDPPIYGGDTVIVDDSTARTAWKQFREVLPVAGFMRPFF